MNFFNKKRKLSKEEKEAYQKSVEETFELSNSSIKEIFKDYKDIDTIIDFYKFASRFYYLSPRNVAMVKKQMPDATFIQTESKWRQMDISPQKETHGIKVIVPQKFSYIIVDKDIVLEHQDLTDKQEELLKSSEAKYVSIKYFDASEEIREIAYERKLKIEEKPGFGKGFVFDVSQTTYSEDYNKLTPFLHGIPDEATYFVYRAISSYINEKTPFSVKEVKFDSLMIGGYYSEEANSICINSLLKDSNKNYILLHELGHALSSNENKLKNTITNSSVNIQKELEKDILSIMSLSMFGLEISDIVEEHFKDDLNSFVSNLEDMNIKHESISNMLQKMSINVMKKFNSNAKEMNAYLYEFDLNKQQDISLEEDASQEEVTLEENKLDEDAEEDNEIEMGF